MCSLFENFLELPTSYFITLFILGIYIYHYLVNVVKKPLLVCAPGDFRKFIDDNVDVIKQKYWPTPWCIEAHAQMILAVIFRELFLSELKYRREIFKLSDGGEVALDWIDNHRSASSPILIILPGLTGDSQADYIKSLLSRTNDINMRIVVFNHRGCGGIPFKTPRAYCAGNHDDFSEILDYVIKSNPNVPIGATGISLGGMILGNYLAYHGEEAKKKLTAAFVLSSPWNLVKSASHMERGVNYVFNYYIVKELIKVIRRMHHVVDEKLFNELNLAFKSRTLRKFDNIFMAKHFGYKDANEYYERSSLHDKFHLIKVPLLIINAADDPYQPLDSLSIELIKQCGNVALIIPFRGGHVAFMEGLWPIKNEQYVTKIFKQYFQAILNNKND